MTEPQDYGRLAQYAAESHLEACAMAQACEEGDHDHPDKAPCYVSPAFGPYCGCTTCVVREVLFAAWPVIEESTRHAGA